MGQGHRAGGEAVYSYAYSVSPTENDGSLGISLLGPKI